MLQLNRKHLYLIEWAAIFLKDILSKANIDNGHGIDHARIVLYHAEEALKYEKVTESQELAIKLAALLHDADDHKFFKNSNNVDIILDIVLNSNTVENNSIKDMVRSMISLVSCSKNRNMRVKPDWLLIPRWADRLEATGIIGIQRAIIYNEYNNRPIIVEDTPIATTIEELNNIATSKRFENYNGISSSLLDHMYDKVLHLSVTTGNKYIDDNFKIRHEDVEIFCLEFSKNKNFQKILDNYNEIY
jgi:uncharacterized protein